MWFANGDHYEGAFYQNRRHGPGKYTFACGDIYIGSSVNGRFVGPGLYTIAATNETLSVRMNGDKVDMALYPDGTKYVGGWKGGFRCGAGVLYRTDGEKCAGLWKDDKLVGKTS